MNVPNQLPETTEISSNDRLWAVLSYLFTPITPVIALMMQETKDRPYSRYHAIQALGLAAVFVVFEILATVVFVCGSAVTMGLGALCLWIVFFLPVPLAIY